MMPVDPQLQPILDVVNEASAAAPPIWEQSVQERREAYLALSAFAGEGPPLDSVQETSIPGPAGEIELRVYRNDGSHGIFVFYHGGGYTIGDLDSHDEVCRQLARQSNSTVVSVHYRLAPEAPFPAGIEDAWGALAHISDHRAAFGHNPDAKIVVGGDSAGGIFAAVMALMARDADLDLAGQLLVYPAVRADDDSPSMSENGEGYLLTRETMEWFNAQYQPDSTDWRASPIYAAGHAGVAPAVVITAEFDPLRDQGNEYAKLLADAGVHVEHTEYEGQVHAFFQLGPIVDAGSRAVTQVAAAAKRLLA